MNKPLCQNRIMSKKYTFVDVFSGCGGFSCGLERAGMKCILGIDIDPDAIETFKLNHKSAQTYCGDVRELKNSALKKLTKNQKVDFVVGGPPCQGFSTVGKGESNDPRNLLFLEFLRIVKSLNPKGIVIENVTGLLANKNKDILDNIFNIFNKMGYRMEGRVLSSDNYGVAEKRRRTILVGFKKGYCHTFPSPTHGENLRRNVKTVRDAFKTIGKKTTYHDKSMAEIKNELDKKRLRYIPEGCGIRYRSDEKRYLPKKLRYDVNWDELREGRFRQTKLQRLSFKEPSYTILTSRTMYYHPREDRYLTPREAAAIQSFPSSFQFYGSVTSVFRQIGNAVPVKMAEEIGKALIKSIDKKSKKTLESRDFKKYAFNYQVDIAA